MAIWDWNQHNFVPKLILNIGNFEKAVFSNSSQETSNSQVYTYTYTAISKEISTWNSDFFRTVFSKLYIIVNANNKMRLR